DPRDRYPGGAEADDQHVQVLDPPPGQLHGVQNGGHHHHGRAVLVVVEHGDLQFGDQPLLDLEAARRRDVLEVDAAEPGRDQLDRVHDLLGVGGVEADRERVDAGELLEQAALALHHRHRGLRADVAEPQHGGAVGDDSHGVPLDRVLKRLVLVVGDRQAHARHARRVDHREVGAGLERVLVGLLDLAPHVQQERAVGRVDHVRARHPRDRRQDPIPVVLAGGVHDDVAQRSGGVALEHVDRADDPGGAAEPAPSERRLFLIDGPSLVYRAFFALPESIATSTGVPTNAIFGFASMLVKILTDYGPQSTVVVWDAGSSGRKEVYAEYKAQRSSRPDLLKEQWPALEPLVDAFGYRNIKVDGYEADDVIASLAEVAKTQDPPIEVMVVTGDRDAYQLVDEQVRIMTTSRGITDTKVYDRQGVIDRYGIPPELVPDFIGLKGDTSDN